MKVKKITYPDSLENYNKDKDNIDVFVELENGENYCVVVATIRWIQEIIKNGYLEQSLPFIIVDEINEELIKKAIENYAQGNAYWLKVYALSCNQKLKLD